MELKNKIRDYIKIIVEKYLLIDQKYAMIVPLLSEPRILSRIDDSLGAIGLNPLRIGVFQSIIGDLSSLIFDNYKSAASLKNIQRMLSETKLLESLKTDFCAQEPIRWVGSESKDYSKVEAAVLGYLSKENANIFKEKLRSFTDSMNLLTTERIEDQLKGARDKMISHFEVKNIDGQRRLYEPKDFELKMDIIDKAVEIVEPIIFDMNLLIQGEWFEKDHSKQYHREIAGDFWERLLG